MSNAFPRVVDVWGLVHDVGAIRLTSDRPGRDLPASAHGACDEWITIVDSLHTVHGAQITCVRCLGFVTRRAT